MAHQVTTRLAAAVAFGLAAAAGADVIAVATNPTAPQAAESPADATGSPAAPPPLYGSTVKCTTAFPARDILAARMARDIGAALAGRADTVVLDVTDSRTGISCWDGASRRLSRPASSS